MEMIMGLSADDRFAVMELAARLYRGLDAHDGEACASLFASDGHLFHVSTGLGNIPRSEIADFVNAWARSEHEESAVHLVSHHIFVDDSESEPVLRMQVTKYRVSTMPPEIWRLAESTLRARKDQGVWKIAHFKAVTYDEFKVVWPQRESAGVPSAPRSKP
jgi:hypothetical protein